MQCGEAGGEIWIGVGGFDTPPEGDGVGAPVADGDGDVEEAAVVGGWVGGVFNVPCSMFPRQLSILCCSPMRPHGEKGNEGAYAAPYPVSVSPFWLGGRRMKSPRAPCNLSKYHGVIISIAPPSGINT